MNVLCTDGTCFRCGRYELTEKGVKLYSGEGEEAPDRYESDTDDHQIGFVPDAMLRYILPEGVRPAGAPPVQQPAQPQGQSVVQPPGRPQDQSTVQAPGQSTAQPPQPGTGGRSPAARR